MSFADELTNFFVAQLSTDPTTKAAIFSDFVAFNLRFYPAYEGRTPDGKLQHVDSIYMLQIAAETNFRNALNDGNSSLRPIKTGAKEFSTATITMLTNCRSSLVETGQAMVDGLTNLAIKEKPGTGRKVLWTDLGCAGYKNFQERINSEIAKSKASQTPNPKK